MISISISKNYHPSMVYLVPTFSPEGSFAFNKENPSATTFATLRRDSDNAELVAGFSGNDIDSSTINAFMGASNLFVKKFADQSGNGLDFEQLTATSQPKFATSGVIETNNGKPCMVFDGVDDFMSAGTTAFDPNGLDTLFVTAAATSSSLNKTIFARSRFAAANGRYAMYGGSGNAMNAIIENAGGSDIRTGGVGAGVYSQLYNGTNHTLYKNDVAQSIGAKTGTLGALTSRFLLGAYNNAGDTGEQAGYFYNGKLQAFHIWLTDQTANRTAINSKINSYYEYY